VIPRGLHKLGAMLPWAARNRLTARSPLEAVSQPLSWSYFTASGILRTNIRSKAWRRRRFRKGGTFARCALTRIDSFKPGTNLQVWLFTILRNEFRSEYRKGRREVEDPEERYVESLRTPPEQLARIEFKELLAALGKPPADQRKVLLLVGAAGFSYDEAAAICGCPIGTIKSRMNRGRIRLAEMLSIESVDDFGPDGVTRAVLIGGVHC
jgi:RNA polymerase sigma-70 factor, ECF subfamily